MGSGTPLLSFDEGNDQHLDDDANFLFSSLTEIIQSNDKQMTTFIRSYDSRKLKDMTKRDNFVLGAIETSTISESKDLLIAGIK